jgi:CubicO group peptidase (beta-lactamase class C family)
MVPATMMLAEEKKLSLDDSITGRLSDGKGADGRDEAA